jgi:hypothetical protein
MECSFWLFGSKDIVHAVLRATYVFRGSEGTYEWNLSMLYVRYVSTPTYENRSKNLCIILLYSQLSRSTYLYCLCELS